MIVRKMIKLWVPMMLIMLSIPLLGQVLEPASWSHKASSNEVRIGDEVELIFKVDLEPTWHLYASDLDPNVGPLPTTFEFTDDPSYELVGEMQQIGLHEKYDNTWEADVRYFSETAEFRQKVKVLSTGLKIEGTYEYLTCTTVDGMCIPGDGTFSFDDIKVQTALDNDKNVKHQESETGEAETLVKVQSDVKKEEVRAISTSSTIDNKYASESKAQVSLVSFALLAFLAGLAALLTPCVFPMIPMTVTFFTDSGQGNGKAIRKAFIYGFSIIAIYTVAGTLVAWINGPEFANWLSTHWVPNVFFFLVFVFFALSFLGLFEITLPSAFVNKVDKQADKGGLYGVFFMAFTLVLVSFSCTGPIVGSILVASAGGAILKPIVGMFAFAMAFAIPFTLFAIFPQWLGNLPKSGGWLNSVKVVLGFLELALGLKFLSIADQVYHWNLLDREIYLVLWIVIFSMMGFYLLGKIRLPHDNILEKIGVPRLILAVVTFSFVLYLIPGLIGAPLKALAGYLPPMSTHDFNLIGLINEREESNASFKMTKQEELCEEPLYADMLNFPHGIKGYFDLEQAQACARKLNKPIFIDFTGHGCVNCREMEARVWSDPEVLKRLKEDFVMLALYVDEKTKLPESEWYTSTYDNKVKKTIGKQNADFQITAFNNNAQPYYVLMDANGRVLAEPVAYNLEVNSFIEFLDHGKSMFFTTDN